MIITDLLVLLPKFFVIGQDVMNCLDGKVTEDEWNKIVDDLGDLAMSYPPAQGFVALIQAVSKVSKIMFPVIEQMFVTKPTLSVRDIMHGTNNDTGKLMVGAMHAMNMQELTKEEFMRAKNAMMLMDGVAAKISAKTEAAVVNQEEVPVDNSWKDSIINPQ